MLYRQLPLRNPEGIYVPLGSLPACIKLLADMQFCTTARAGFRPSRLNVAGGDTGAFVRNAQREIGAKVKLAPGDYVQFTGTAEAEARRTGIF